MILISLSLAAYATFVTGMWIGTRDALEAARDDRDRWRRMYQRKSDQQ